MTLPAIPIAVGIALASLLAAFPCHAAEEIAPMTAVVVRGMSLTSPDEKGWVQSRGAAEVTLGKLGPDGIASSVIRVRDIQSPCPATDEAFLDIVKRLNAKVPGRFRVRETNVELDKSRAIPFRRKAPFANFHYVVEDSEAPQKPANQSFVVFETMGFVACHPVDPGLVVLVEYTSRYDPGREDKDFKPKARWVLERATFTTPRE